MKIRLMKPFAQPSLGKVIPAGVVIDAPAALCARLQREGRGEPVQPDAASGRAVATPGNRQSVRKKVKKGDG